MKARIARCDDLEEARALHNMAFGSAWPGDDHEFWFAYDEAGGIVGFCSAKFIPKFKAVFLSRAAVHLRARGIGLHKRLIRVRVEWAKTVGADLCITYTSLRNYKSMLNLVACGFRFSPQKSQKPWHLMHLWMGKTKDAPFKRLKASWSGV